MFDWYCRYTVNHPYHTNSITVLTENPVCGAKGERRKRKQGEQVNNKAVGEEMDKKRERVYLQRVQVALEVLQSLSNLLTPADTHIKLLNVHKHIHVLLHDTFDG